MKSLFLACLLFASVGVSADDSVSVEIPESQLEALEKEGTAEVLPVRPQMKGESDKEYADYLYYAAGIETHMLPTGAMVGIGVRDKNDVINGEVRIKANFVGLYNGRDGVALGAGVQGYVKPFRLLGKNAKFLGGAYVGAGYEKYATGRTVVDSATNVEVGYELQSFMRIGLAKENWKKANGSEQEVFLIKLSTRWPSRRR